MRAGDLRHKVTFQTKSGVADGMLGDTEAWTDALTTRAAIWPMRGNERLEAMKLAHAVTHKIRVRYRSAINARMRIEFGSRYFEIIGMTNPDERGVMLEIMAREDE